MNGVYNDGATQRLDGRGVRGSVRLPAAETLAGGSHALDADAHRATVSFGPDSEGRSVSQMIRELGDGEFGDQLRERHRLGVAADLMSEDVASVAADMLEIVSRLSAYDEDDAWEVNAAAFDYLQAVERFCRRHMQSGG